MKKILAAITATMCGICVTSMSNMALASGTETENRDTVIEQSLILPENIAYIWDTLSQYLWDKETNTRTMDAFIELDKDRKIIIVADNEEILATAKSFVKGKELDESFIDYRIESFEDMIHDGYTVETPVTNDELKHLLKHCRRSTPISMKKVLLTTRRMLLSIGTSTLSIAMYSHMLLNMKSSSS